MRISSRPERPARNSISVLVLLVVTAVLAVLLAPVQQANAVVAGTTPSSAPSWFTWIQWVAGAKTYHCSGALVSPQWVLTAGHCMTEASTSRQAKAKEVTVWVGYRSPSSKGTKRSVVSIARNGYAAADGYIRNDVALLKLSSVVSTATQPLSVAPGAAAAVQNTRVTLYGAGETDSNMSTTTSGTLHTTVTGDWTLDSSCQLASQGISCLQTGTPQRSYGEAGDSGGPWIATIDGTPVLMTVFTGYAAAKYGPNSAYGTAPGSTQTLPWLRRTAGIPDLAVGTIVRDPATAESWLIGDYGYRLPIGDGNTYLCLTGKGAPVVNLARPSINLIPVRTSTAQCTVTNGSNVLLVGSYTASTDWLSGLLTQAGYTVTTVPDDVLPADISGYRQVWDVSIVPLPPSDQDRLVTFAKGGGGVYLTGERPCCEDLNVADATVINDLVVTVGGVQAGGMGDPYYATGPLPINSQAAGGVTQRPFALTSWQPSAPGGMANVSAVNVISTATPGDTYNSTGTAVAAVWDRGQVVGGGRLVIMMDVNWMESGYRDDTTATQLAQNLALFLGGLTSPPGSLVQATPLAQPFTARSSAGESSERTAAP